MKEIQNFAGQIYEAIYLGNVDFKDLNPLWQVYGFFFNGDGKLLINDDGRGNWRLPGGKIENNENYKDAIIRETFEEADVTIEEDSIKVFGVIEMIPKSDTCKKPKHYLLRCSGKIKEIKEQTADPDSGLICERKFIDPKNFNKYVNWGDFGELVKNEAIKSLRHKKVKSVAAIIFNKGKFMIVKKSKDSGGFWDFPKDGIKRYEDEIVALNREMKEETNLEIELIPGFYEEIKYNYSDSVYDYDKTVGYYLAKAKTIDCKSNDEDEIEECMWATAEEVREKVKFEDSIKVFEKVLEK